MNGNANPNAGYDSNAVEYNANHSIDWYNQQNQYYAQQQQLQQQYYAGPPGWPGVPPFAYGQQQFYPHSFDPQQQMPTMYQGQEMYQNPSQQNYEAQATAAASVPEALGGAILSGAAIRKNNKLAAAQSQQYQASLQPQFLPQMPPPPPPFYTMQAGQMPYPHFEHPAFVITQQPQLNPSVVHPPQFQQTTVSQVVPPSQVIPLTGVIMQPKTAVKGNKYDESLTENFIKRTSNPFLTGKHILNRYQIQFQGVFWSKTSTTKRDMHHSTWLAVLGQK